MKEFSLHVVGVPFPNRDGSNRRFEVHLCAPGEPVTLVREPKNPADPRAVAVRSARGVQIGYLSAERAPWFSAMLAEGRPLTAIFQARTPHGAAIRVALDGATPTLPAEEPIRVPQESLDDWTPDYIPPDD
jgi:hypothetical protein